MKRRTVLGIGLALPMWTSAHHGWSSFDQARPLWLEGRASEVLWRNPHVELKLETSSAMKLPANLRTRRLPEQTAAVDGPALLAAAALPKRTDRVWEVELAPLTRMQAWKVSEIKSGTDLAVLGFTFQGEQGRAVLRAEYLFLGDQTYGLRSSPV
jgi:Family of unknown function (DUF6152)